MSLVKMYFSSLDDDIKQKEPGLYASFEEGNRFLDDAFLEVRAIIREMKEGKTSGKGLEHDIQQLTEKVEKIGVKVEAEINLVSELKGETELNLYRIIQEAVSNSLKYSHAGNISLVLNEGEQLSLIIKDNGVGMNLSEKTSNPDTGGGYGLGNMENRVKLMGGTFTLKTAKDEGVEISILIPTAKEEPA